jgi:hypothetical protein
MKPETTTLAKRLQREAVDQAEHPAEAVSALVSAAASILQPTFGEEGTLAMLTQALDATGALWRARNAN